MQKACAMLVDFQKASIGYGEKVILKDLDFTLEAGEFVFLTGKVGTGKTTFLKSIYAEAQVISAEKAQVLGFDMLSLKKRQIPRLRRKTGFVFQDFKFLTDRDVYENLRFVLRATGLSNEMAIKRRIKEALDTVGMYDYVHAMPYELSGGQQQKVAIARAVLNNPQLILADEPTGNLDEQASRQIVEILYNFSRKGAGVIFVTHDLSLLSLVGGARHVQFQSQLAGQKQ